MWELLARLVSLVPGEITENIAIKLLRQRLNREDQLDLVRNIARLKKDGIRDRMAITILMAEYQEEMGENSNEVKFCKSVLQEMGQGSVGIADAMKEWCDPDITQIMKTTSVSKDSLEAITQLLRQIEKWNVTQGKVKKAIKEPAGWILTSLGVTWVASTVAVRGASGDTPKEEWTNIALAYDSLGTWLTSNSSLLGFILFGVCFLYFWLMCAYDGHKRLGMDVIPGFGLYRASEASRFFSIMSVLVNPSCGKKKLNQALEEFEINSDLVSPYLRLHIDEMIDRAQEGKFSLEQLDTGLLPSRMRIRLGVAGKKAGGQSMSETFEDISNNLALDYSQEIIKKIQASMVTIQIGSVFVMLGALIAVMDGLFKRLDVLL